MTKAIRRALSLALMLFPTMGFAQGERPACALMKGLDLKPLLGADHDAPVPFGKDSCRAESKSPGKLVALGVMEEKPSELKAWFAGVRKMNATQRAKEVTVVAEPALGADAFSVRERGEMRDVEIYASKGTRAIVLQANWAIGAPFNDTSLKQLQQLVKSALDKLP